MSLIKHKKVELTELFYDLVYVYTISQLTSIIHHAHEGIVSPLAFFNFSVGLIIFINSWMVQTVYTNRFGSNSLLNIIFMFLQMLCLLAASNAVSGDWQENFVWIFLPMAIISLILLFQYIVEYLTTSKKADRAVIKPFFHILGLRSASLFLALLFPFSIGIWIAVVGVVTTWILPGLLTSPKSIPENPSPFNFPHLVERLSLLVIITLGETLVGIAEHFSPGNFSLLSVLIFFILTNVFMIYIVEIDHLLDVNREETGIRAIYSHYPILFGLSLITIALSFFGSQEMSRLYTTLYFYIGLGLFMSGLWQNGVYNKAGYQFTKQLLLIEFLTPLLGFIVSLVLVSSSWLSLVLIASAVTFIMMASFVSFNLRGPR